MKIRLEITDEYVYGYRHPILARSRHSADEDYNLTSSGLDPLADEG